jgi:hypothetical protein
VTALTGVTVLVTLLFWTHGCCQPKQTCTRRLSKETKYYWKSRECIQSLISFVVVLGGFLPIGGQEKVTRLCPAEHTVQTYPLFLIVHSSRLEQQPVMSLPRRSALGGLCALLVFATHVAAGLLQKNSLPHIGVCCYPRYRTAGPTEQQ